MSISIFAPLIYFLIGLGLGKANFDIKGKASALLTKFVIPFVIIYNISTHRSGVFVIMLGTIAMMGLMVFLSRLFTRDPIQTLCFCYLNIGWLGLPIASTLFGNEAAMVIIAAYLGSSIFGNSIGVGLLTHGQDLKARLRKTLQAPPFLALLIGLACIPFGKHIEFYIRPEYEALKFLMSFLGMAILGIWLSTTTISYSDFKRAFLPFTARLFVTSILITLFILTCQHYAITLVIENKPALYLISFLPPAANIIVLETHYMKSGRSAAMIACGTCLSIIASGLYVGAVLWLDI
jgi:predicted permease